MAEGAPSAGGTPEGGGEPTQTPGTEPKTDKGHKLDTAEPEGPQGDLPGVMPRGIEGDIDAAIAEAMGFDGEGDRKARTKKPKGEGEGEGDSKGRGRDPKTGRFLAKDGGQEPPPAEGKPGDAPPLPEGQQPPETPPAKFKFGGVEFDNQEAAEQNFRSLRGTYKQKEERVREVESERDRGYQAAYAWKAEAERHAARIAELEQQLGSGRSGDGSGAPQGGDSEEVTVESLMKGLDLGAIEHIAQNGNPAMLTQYILKQTLGLVNEKLIPQAVNSVRKEFEGRLSVHDRVRQEAETVGAMSEAVKSVAALKLEDGSPALPEVHDAQELQAVVRLWGRMSQNDQDAAARLRMLTTRDGLLQAVANYRLYKGFSTPTSPTPTPSTPDPAASLPATPPSPDASSSLSVAGRDGFTPGSPSNLPPGMAGMAAALGKADLVDEELGFARNRAT